MTTKPNSLPDEVWASVVDPARREVIAALSVLDSAPDPDFDRLSRMASALFGVPIGLVTIVDAERQWFKSHHGTEMQETRTDTSFCAHAIAEREKPYLLIEDMLEDARFATNPLVTGEPFVRFYAGAPITVRGERLGTLCVLSKAPARNTDPQKLEQLVELAGIAGSLFELKDEARTRARMAAELIKEEWRHALTLEAGKVGSWVWDLRTGEIVANDIFRRMFDLTPNEKVIFDKVYDQILPEDRAALDAALQLTFDQGVDYVAEFRIRNTKRWLTGRGRVYQRDSEGKPLLLMGVNLDVTDARESADQTRLLLRELNHRVKNTLAMIQSLARQTMRQNPDPKLFMDAFSGRLRTLSEAHALLADRDWSGIALTETIRSQVVSMVRFDPAQVQLEGEDAFLPPDHALGLGLILHELTSNAVRHGALSVPEGRVSLRWQEEAGDPRLLRMVWKESNGPKVAQPVETGFGTRLIERSLDKVLGSKVTLNLAEDGVETEILLPLSADS